MFFVFFSIVKHKEVRFMLLFLPYLYILASYGIFSVFNKIKNKKLVFYFFLLISLIWFVQTSYQIKYNYDNEIKINKYETFQNYLGGEDVTGIWISNPVFAVNSDRKIDELMYSPTFNHDKFLFLKENLGVAENVLINTCDLYCEPYNEYCEGDKIELIGLLRERFEMVFYEKERECGSYMFAE